MSRVSDLMRSRLPRFGRRTRWTVAILAVAVDRPKLYVNLGHLRAEAADPRPVAKHGWQEAFQAISPLKINRFTIANGEATYVDDGPFEPLELSAINLVADDIRNIRSRERDYPSAVHLDAVVFKRGKVTIDGHADFLAEPHLGIKADVALDQIELDYFKPLTRRYNVAVNKGVLSASGLVEYAPSIKWSTSRRRRSAACRSSTPTRLPRKGSCRRPPPRPWRPRARRAMIPASSSGRKRCGSSTAPSASSERAPQGNRDGGEHLRARRGRQGPYRRGSSSSCSRTRSSRRFFPASTSRYA